MTPKVEKQEKKKVPKGRAKKRLLYTRKCLQKSLFATFVLTTGRFVNVTLTNGKRKSNPSPSS
jgi:small subunit ribosomal protein S30e